MAGSLVKGDLSVSRAIDSIRNNEALTNITAGTTLALNSSKYIDNTATSAIIVVLPDATTLTSGWAVYVMNNGTGTVTVNLNGGTNLGSIPVGNTALIVNRTTAAAAGTWEFINLDIDTSGVTKTTVTFDATTSWGTAAGGEYTITTTAAVAMGGATPEFTVYESSGDDFIKIDGIEAVVDGSTGNEGNIAIRVNETPDERFAGRIVIV